MIDTSKQNNLAGGETRARTNLKSKVVLLIGNNADVMHSLAVTFAAKGSDIVLASSRLPAGETSDIRESVKSFGGRFLLIDKKIIDKKMEMVVSKVKKEMGGMDILIDMSARNHEIPEDKTNGEEKQPQLWLSNAVLQEIRS